MVAFRDSERFGFPSGKRQRQRHSVPARGRSFGITGRDSGWRDSAGDVGRSLIIPRGNLMPPPIIRNGPLNVLVALADPDLDVARILPVLQSHYALVCSAPAQAVEAAWPFEPDIILVDCRVPNPVDLARRLSRAAGNRPVVFVAMVSPGRSVPTGFQYSLSMPGTASDLECLLWHIGGGRAVGAARVVEPGAEMTG